MKFVGITTFYLTLLSLTAALKERSASGGSLLQRIVRARGRGQPSSSSHSAYSGSKYSSKSKPSHHPSSYSSQSSRLASPSYSSHTSYKKEKKCLALPKMVCKDVEVEDLDYGIETHCETTNVNKCVNVTESTLITQQVEECRDVAQGFRKIQIFSTEDVCVDFTENICEDEVNFVTKLRTERKCTTKCSESCAEKSRIDCSPTTKEESTEEFVRLCTKGLVTQCTDCHDCHTNSGHIRSVNCTRGLDGRDVCPIPQVCSQNYLEKCEPPKSVLKTKTTTECNCQEVIDGECKPESTEECTDVVTEQEEAEVGEQCMVEEKTACEEQSVPSYDVSADVGCIGHDQFDPECFTISQSVCALRDKLVEVMDEREQCFTVPCEQCRDLLVEIPTVKIDTVCKAEDFEVCEPEDDHQTSNYEDDHQTSNYEDDQHTSKYEDDHYTSNYQEDYNSGHYH